MLGQLPQADVIALTCPLTSETERLIDAAAFAAMKPSAFLVNVLVRLTRLCLTALGSCFRPSIVQELGLTAVAIGITLGDVRLQDGGLCFGGILARPTFILWRNDGRRPAEFVATSLPAAFAVWHGFSVVGRESPPRWRDMPPRVRILEWLKEPTAHFPPQIVPSESNIGPFTSDERRIRALKQEMMKRI